MLPEEQESELGRIIEEDNPSLSGNIQAAHVKRQEEKDIQNYANFRIIAKNLMKNQEERKIENKNFNKHMLPKG